MTDLAPIRTFHDIQKHSRIRNLACVRLILTSKSLKISLSRKDTQKCKGCNNKCKKFWLK